MKKRIALIALVAVMVFVFAACGNKAPETDDTNPGSDIVTDNDDNAQLPNPFTTYETVEAAKGAIGFDFAVPGAPPQGYTLAEISVMQADGSSFAQLIYEDADGKQLTYRVSADTSVTGLDGDYNSYDNERTVTIGELEVVCRGDGDTVSVATWQTDGYSYALMADQPLSEAQLQELIESIL